MRVIEHTKPALSFPRHPISTTFSFTHKDRWTQSAIGGRTGKLDRFIYGAPWVCGTRARRRQRGRGRGRGRGCGVCGPVCEDCAVEGGGRRVAGTGRIVVFGRSYRRALDVVDDALRDILGMLVWRVPILAMVVVALKRWSIFETRSSRSGLSTRTDRRRQGGGRRCRLGSSVEGFVRRWC